MHGQDDLERVEGKVYQLLQLAAAGRGRRKAHLDPVAGATSSRAHTVCPAAASRVEVVAPSSSAPTSNSTSTGPQSRHSASEAVGARSVSRSRARPEQQREEGWQGRLAAAGPAAGDGVLLDPEEVDARAEEGGGG